MLETYKFLHFPGPEETRLRHLVYGWDLIKTRAFNTLEDVTLPGKRELEKESSRRLGKQSRPFAPPVS